MIDTIRFDAAPGDLPTRLRIGRPARADGSACILLNSGRVARFDDERDEARLFLDLHHALCERGVTSIEVDLPARDPGARDPTETAIAARLLRLRALLDAADFRPWLGNYSVLALSLGGQVVLRQLASSDARPAPRVALLLGTVVEAPVVITGDVREIHLVYGENDCIGYLDPQSEQVQFQRPIDYARACAQCLVLRRSQRVACHILAGCGHTLNRIGPHAADPVAALLALLPQAPGAQAASV